MINNSSIDGARKAIKSCREKPIIVRAQGDEFNRKILEYGSFDILVLPFFSAGKDSLRQLDSGLNHVLARIAEENGVAIGLDLRELRNLPKAEKAEFLARVRQNIVICRKAGAKLALLNYNDKIGAFFFLISLGASTQQAKGAVFHKI